MKLIALIGAVLLIGGLILVSNIRTTAPDDTQAYALKITVPPTTPATEVGAQLFEENCAVCHGPAGAGSPQGPPLIHKIYEPSHHADASFALAAVRGVRAHHWNFGDMPPVPTVTQDDVAQITAFIRNVQRANGIN